VFFSKQVVNKCVKRTHIKQRRRCLTVSELTGSTLTMSVIEGSKMRMSLLIYVSLIVMSFFIYLFVFRVWFIGHFVHSWTQENMCFLWQLGRRWICYKTNVLDEYVHLWWWRLLNRFSILIGGTNVISYTTMFLTWRHLFSSVINRYTTC